MRTVVDAQLIFYDEICATVWGDSALEELFEFSVWTNCMIRTLRHPLFKEWYHKEKEAGMWSKKFELFYEKHQSRIAKRPEPEDY